MANFPTAQNILILFIDFNKCPSTPNAVSNCTFSTSCFHLYARISHVKKEEEKMKSKKEKREKERKGRIKKNERCSRKNRFFKRAHRENFFYKAIGMTRITNGAQFGNTMTRQSLGRTNNSSRFTALFVILCERILVQSNSQRRRYLIDPSVGAKTIQNLNRVTGKAK